MKNTYFANNVRYFREAKGLKQTQIIDYLGIKQSTWNNYEKGVSTPNLDDIIKIASFLGVDLDSLIKIDLTKGKVITDDDEEKNTQKGKGNGKGNGKVYPQISPPAPIVSEPESTYAQPPPGSPPIPCQQCQVYRTTITLQERIIASQEVTISSLQTALKALQAQLSPMVTGGALAG